MKRGCDDLLKLGHSDAPNLAPIIPGDGAEIRREIKHWVIGANGEIDGSTKGLGGSSETRRDAFLRDGAAA